MHGCGQVNLDETLLRLYFSNIWFVVASVVRMGQRLSVFATAKNSNQKILLVVAPLKVAGVGCGRGLGEKEREIEGGGGE